MKFISRSYQKTVYVNLYYNEHEEYLIQKFIDILEKPEFNITYSNNAEELSFQFNPSPTSGENPLGGSIFSNNFLEMIGELKTNKISKKHDCTNNEVDLKIVEEFIDNTNDMLQNDTENDTGNTLKKSSCSMLYRESILAISSSWSFSPGRMPTRRCSQFGAMAFARSTRR